jgi:hypothetical protein
MNKIPDLREIPLLPDEISQAGLNGNLILFVGAGLSMMLGLPSWGGMAWQALLDLKDNGLINFSELDQLKNLDAKKQLSIALLIAEENEFPLDLTKKLKLASEGETIYKALNDIGCACVTTNYDLLLSPRFHEFKEDPLKSASVTPQNCKRIYNKANFLAKYLTEPGTVIHLHGAIEDPVNMVVTTKDYLQHYDDKNVQHFLNQLFDKYVILFLGYGLEEAEILEHILRRGSAHKTPDRKRFVLQGYFNSQAPLYKNMHQYYKKSFGVHLLGFIRDHSDYNQQEDIIKSWAPQLKIRKPELTDDIDRINEVLEA